MHNDDSHDDVTVTWVRRIAKPEHAESLAWDDDAQDRIPIAYREVNFAARGCRQLPLVERSQRGSGDGFRQIFQSDRGSGALSGCLRGVVFLPFLPLYR